MKKISLLFLVILFTSKLFAQTPQTGREVSGVVQDTAGTGVLGATVTLTPISGKGDSVTIRTNADGIFVLKNVKISQFNLSVKSLGYGDFVGKFQYPDGTSRIVLDKIVLKSGASVLDEVVITGAPPVTIKKDTIEYKAADFKLKENAVAEDLIKRLDGVEVDKDGNISSQGKSVTKFRINGKDSFGGDLKTATKNIPVDMIDKIQLVDDYGEQANFTGVRDGDPETIINITTRAGRDKGTVGNTTAGGGTQDRYQFSLFGNQFHGERSVGITANLNNNGAQVGGGNFGGRGGRGGGGGGVLTSGGNSGITALSAVGLSYNDRWSPKLQVNAGYFFNGSNNNTITTKYSETANSLGNIIANSNSNNKAIGNAHNFNARLQYNINAKNLLVIMPALSFSNSTGDNSNFTSQKGVIRQDQTTATNTKSTTPNYSGNILYNHLFKKTGRNYSLNINLRNNTNNSDQDNDNNILYYNPSTSALVKDSLNHRIINTDNTTFTGSSRFIYSEPLNLTSRLQFSYNLNYSNYDNSKITNFVNKSGVQQKIDSLSNIFQYSFTSHQLGLNYNYRNQNNDFSLGLTVIPTILSGSSASLHTTISRKNVYLAPILRYSYRYSRTKVLMVSYNGLTSEPQFAQLQPVRDVSNPQRPVVGNPNLNNQFTHRLNANYNTSNPLKRTSFMILFNGSVVKDFIATNTVLVPDVYGSFKQEVHYLNTNGAYSYGGNYNWLKSFADRQYTVRLSGGANFVNSITFADNIKNFSKVLNLNQRLALEIRPGTWLELSPSVAYSVRNSNYTLATSTDTKIKSYTMSVYGTLYFLKSRSLLLNFSGDKTFNSGYTSNLNTNPLVVNSYIEKQFLKNKTASMRLTAFDLFKQANNITQTTTDNGFTNSNTNRLNQYFMLTATMRLNRFGGVNVGGQGGGRGGQPGGGQRGGQGQGGFGGEGGQQRGGAGGFGGGF
jgi:hypothetical protein